PRRRAPRSPRAPVARALLPADGAPLGPRPRGLRGPAALAPSQPRPALRRRVSDPGRRSGPRCPAWLVGAEKGRPAARPLAQTDALALRHRQPLGAFA